MKSRLAFSVLAISICYLGCASTGTMQEKASDEITWETVAGDIWDSAYEAAINEAGPSDLIDTSYGETVLIYAGGMLLYRGGKYLWSKVDFSSTGTTPIAAPPAIEIEEEAGYLIDGQLLAMGEPDNRFSAKTLSLKLDIATGHIIGTANSENGQSYEVSGDLDLDGSLYMHTVENGKPILEIVGYFATESGEGECKVKEDPNIIWRLNQRK